MNCKTWLQVWFNSSWTHDWPLRTETISTSTVFTVCVCLCVSARVRAQLNKKWFRQTSQSTLCKGIAYLHSFCHDTLRNHWAIGVSHKLEGNKEKKITKKMPRGKWVCLLLPSCAVYGTLATHKKNVASHMLVEHIRLKSSKIISVNLTWHRWKQTLHTF